MRATFECVPVRLVVSDGLPAAAVGVEVENESLVLFITPEVGGLFVC